MAAGLLQHLRPDDIVFLVETRLQLHQDGDLLAVLRRLGEGRDDRGIAADAVQGLLDGQHLRIGGSVFDKFHNRIKGLVRVMEQDIPFADFLKDVAVRRQLLHRRRHMLRILQLVKARKAVHLHQEGQVERPVDLIDGLVPDVKFLPQKLEQLLVYLLLYLQADHLAPLAFFQLLLDLLQEIRRVVLLNGQVSVAHDPVGRGADNIIAQEQLLHVPLNDLLQQDHIPASVLSMGKRDDPGQHGGHLHGGELQHLLLSLLVLLGEKCSDIQRLIADQREGSGRIHRHGRQHRIDIVPEIAVHILCLLFRQRLMLLDHIQTVLAQKRKQGAGIGGILEAHQLLGLLADLVELLLGRQARDILFCIARVHHIL